MKEREEHGRYSSLPYYIRVHLSYGIGVKIRYRVRIKGTLAQEVERILGVRHAVDVEDTEEFKFHMDQAISFADKPKNCHSSRQDVEVIHRERRKLSV